MKKVEKIQLITERLLLRPPQMSDAATIQALAGDWDIAKMTTNMPHPYEDGMAEAFIESIAEHSDDHFSFAIIQRDSEQLIGMIGIHCKPQHRRAEIGYWVGKPYWGNGYASEAARQIVAFGFRELGLNRIYANYYIGNPASRRVMEKAGMTYEGMMRQHVSRLDKDNETHIYHDIGCCGILRDEWQSQQA